MTDSQPRFARTPNIVARRVGGETLLVPTMARSVDEGRRSAELFVLNETGERMWEWLATPNTAADLARNLIGEFEVTPQAAQSDAEAFLRSLEEAGLVMRMQIGS